MRRRHVNSWSLWAMQLISQQPTEMPLLREAERKVHLQLELLNMELPRLSIRFRHLNVRLLRLNLSCQSQKNKAVSVPWQHEWYLKPVQQPHEKQDHILFDLKYKITCEQRPHVSRNHFGLCRWVWLYLEKSSCLNPQGPKLWNLFCNILL